MGVRLEKCVQGVFLKPQKFDSTKDYSERGAVLSLLIINATFQINYAMHLQSTFLKFFFMVE